MYRFAVLLPAVLLLTGCLGRADHPRMSSLEPIGSQPSDAHPTASAPSAPDPSPPAARDAEPAPRDQTVLPAAPPRPAGPVPLEGRPSFRAGTDVTIRLLDDAEAAAAAALFTAQPGASPAPAPGAAASPVRPAASVAGCLLRPEGYDGPDVAAPTELLLHDTVRGDTWSGLRDSYGSDYEAFALLNRLTPAEVREGRSLFAGVPVWVSRGPLILCEAS